MINRKKKIKEVERHWKAAGRKHYSVAKNTSTPTSRDPFLSYLERESIVKYLNPGQVVLELGCGDGLHTIEYSKYVKKIYAIDFIEDLVKKAKKNSCIRKRGNTSFYCSSVQNIDKLLNNKHKFDVVISQRCLINLASWKEQVCAIEKIASLLKKGGLFLLAEGFMQELANLNIARKELGLEKIRVVNYNLFFDRKKFEAEAKRFFDILGKNYFGMYMFLSRVVYPMSIFPHSPKHGSKFNQIAYYVSGKITSPELDRFGYDTFYALKRK